MPRKKPVSHRRTGKKDIGYRVIMLQKRKEAREARESKAKKSKLHSTVEDVSHESDHDGTEKQDSPDLDLDLQMEVTEEDFVKTEVEEEEIEDVLPLGMSTGAGKLLPLVKEQTGNLPDSSITMAENASDVDELVVESMKDSVIGNVKQWTVRASTMLPCVESGLGRPVVTEHDQEEHGQPSQGSSMDHNYCTTEISKPGVSTESMDKPASRGPYCCSMCERKFNRQISFQTHLEKEHPTKVSYKCTCGEIYSTARDLAAHRKTHLLLSCDICQKTFANQNSYKSHTRVYHEMKCNICRTNFTSGADLAVHEQQAHSFNMYFKCLVCLKKFSSMKAVISHHKSGHLWQEVLESTKETTPQFTCRYCELKFATHITCTNHEGTHLECKKFYKCAICLKQCPTILAHDMHVKSKHDFSKSFECPICEKAFSLRSAFYKHQEANKNLKCYVCKEKFNSTCLFIKDKRAHAAEKSYLCQLCGKRCATDSNLAVHLQIHADEKRYQCSICGKTFNTKSGLNLHQAQAVHGKGPLDKKYTCKICGKGWPNFSQLSTHMNKHTGEKPYKCDTCGKGFSAPGSVSVHKRTHTGEKPYKCTVCGKGHTTSSNLKAHMRTH